MKTRQDKYFDFANFCKVHFILYFLFLQESVGRDHKMMRGWFDAFRENGEFSFSYSVTNKHNHYSLQNIKDKLTMGMVTQVVQRCTRTATGRLLRRTRPP